MNESKANQRIHPDRPQNIFSKYPEAIFEDVKEAT